MWLDDTGMTQHLGFVASKRKNLIGSLLLVAGLQEIIKCETFGWRVLVCALLHTFKSSRLLFPPLPSPLFLHTIFSPLHTQAFPREA